MRIKFTKMSGAGNDFVVLGPEFAGLVASASSLAKSLCARGTSVGADGLIIVEHGETGVVMHYFNSDGSDASFCGNGARCLVLYCKTKSIGSHPLEFSSRSGRHVGWLTGDGVCISLGAPEYVKDVRLPADDSGTEVHLVDAGVPHAVIFVEAVTGLDAEGLGRRIRHDPAFGEEGANADFVAARPDGTFDIRTYERGVERETLACGSGCVAAACALKENGLAGSVVRFNVASGDVLEVDLEGERTGAHLTGPASIVFEGIIELKESGDV